MWSNGCREECEHGRKDWEWCPVCNPPKTGDPITVVATNGGVVPATFGGVRRLGHFLPIPDEPNQFVPLYYRLEDHQRTWNRRPS